MHAGFETVWVNTDFCRSEKHKHKYYKGKKPYNSTLNIPLRTARRLGACYVLGSNPIYSLGAGIHGKLTT